MINIYNIAYDDDWAKYFDLIEKEIKERAVKKIKKILEFPEKRHLKKGANFFVAEVGQYRILYRVFEENNEVRFYFIGNHKQYVKWYLMQ